MSFRRRGQARTLLPFGLDYADVSQGVTGEALKFPIPVNGKPTALEDDSAKQFTNFADAMKNGSFYTGTLQSLQKEGSNGNNTYYEGGANDGLKRYSDKFRKKVKTGRSLGDHPFILEFFPDELHNVLIPKSSKTASLQLEEFSDEGKIKKAIKISEEEKKRRLEDRLNDVDTNDAESDAAEEEEDEEFEDNDSDDYNAEQYFDDGDGDEGDYGGDDEGNGNEPAFG